MRLPGSAPYRVTFALVAVLALASAASACTRTTLEDEGYRSTTTEGSTVEPTDPQGSTPTAPTPAPLTWTSCHGDLECATLEVPLDYDDPTGTTIELALSRQPAEIPSERIGSLLMNPGGPGASGIELLQSDQFDGELADRFDLVGWDPRGVGDSVPLACDTDFDQLAFRELDSDPDTPEETEELEASGQELATLCATSDLDVLRNFDTPTTARDLDQIRAAVGDEKLSYIGFSYGTQIGQEYARLFPDKVRAITLDGVVDPSQSLQDMLRDQALSIEDAFPDATLRKFDRVLAAAEVSPLEGPQGTELGPGMVTLAAVAASYYPEGARYLSMALDAALAGDGELLEELALAYVESGSSFAAYVGVVCVDSPFEPGAAAWQQFAAELEAVSPRFGAAVANELISCAFWPVPPGRQPSLVTTEGLPPVLVVGTTGDAATPYENAQRVADAMPGAVLLTLEADGHTAFGKSDCIDDAVASYFVDLETPPPGTVCTLD